MEIITTAGLLVEIMRKELDKPFTEAADLTGPYPSGDMGIFIDVAARLGEDTGVIGAVGNDDFGRCIIQRFQQDGVDVSLLTVVDGATTGTAFVAYYQDGSRDFVYHLAQSAASMVDVGSITPEKLKDVKWAHASGVNMAAGENLKNAILRMVECLPQGAKLSFDPNIRPEVLSADEIRQLCAPLMQRADIFFPSKGEAEMFTLEASDEAGCRKLAAGGKLVVMKDGEKGCVVYSGDEVIRVPSFTVQEVDPTGAGDSFCAGFISALEKGWGLYECGEFANAVGALSVQKKGPMEGAPYRADVLAFLKQNSKNAFWQAQGL